MAGALADEVLFTGVAAVDTLLVEAESVAGVASVEISDAGVSVVAVPDVTSVGALETSAAPFPEAKGLDSDGSIDKYFAMSAAGASAGVLSAGAVAVGVLLETVAPGIVFVMADCETTAFLEALLAELVTHSTSGIVAVTEFVMADG